MGNYSMALSYFEKVLEIHQKSLSSDHPNLALNYYNIGEVHHSMGNYSMALSFLEKALEIQQRSLPSDHPDLVTTQENIGIVSQLTGLH
jgi:tetratricopeptide (TPR) repeat protein